MYSLLDAAVDAALTFIDNDDQGASTNLFARVVAANLRDRVDNDQDTD